MRIKKGDNVKIILGKDRGKSGKVVNVLREKNRVVVENINKVKKHVRPKRQGEKGQKMEISVPLDVSNVMLICPKCNKATRIGVKVSESGKRFRICKKCKETI